MAVRFIRALSTDSLPNDSRSVSEVTVRDLNVSCDSMTNLTSPDRLSPVLWTPLKRLKKEDILKLKKSENMNNGAKNSDESSNEKDSPKDKKRKYAFLIPKIEIS